MNRPNAQNSSEGTSKNLGFNLISLVLMVTLVTIGVAYTIDALVRHTETDKYLADDGYRLEKIIAGVTLKVPPAWLIDPAQIPEKFADRLDLLLPVKFGPDLPTQTIRATLKPRAGIYASAQLLDTVYLHRDNTPHLTADTGLVGKNLLAKDGYQTETVWYDPISPNPFVAKCAQQITLTDHPICLRTLILPSGIAVTLVFEERALRHWRIMDQALAHPFDAIGAGPLH